MVKKKDNTIPFKKKMNIKLVEVISADGKWAPGFGPETPEEESMMRRAGFYLDIARALYNMRETLKLTNEDLAKKSGLDVKYIGQILRGKCNNNDDVFKLFDVMGCYPKITPHKGTKHDHEG